MNKSLTLALLASFSISMIASDQLTRAGMSPDMQREYIKMFGLPKSPAVLDPTISTQSDSTKVSTQNEVTSDAERKKDADQASRQAELKKAAAINAEPKGDNNTQILHATLLENQQEILKQLAELKQMVKAQQNKAPQRPARISTNASDNTFAQMPRH